MDDKLIFFLKNIVITATTKKTETKSKTISKKSFEKKVRFYILLKYKKFIYRNHIVEI